jgi:hypothetical protein
VYRAKSRSTARHRDAAARDLHAVRISAEPAPHLRARDRAARDPTRPKAVHRAKRSPLRP